MHPKKPKRSKPFQKDHDLTYGVRVTEVDPRTKLVRSVVCRFCEMCGREERPGRKRKENNNAQYYTAPFRPESHRRHNESQHQTKWREYQSISEGEKNSFFDGVVPIKRTLLSHFRTQNAQRLFEIDVGIIETIIAGIYFDIEDECDSDDDDGDEENAYCADGRLRSVQMPEEIKKRALSIFVAVRENAATDEDLEESAVSAYKVTIKNGSLYDLVVEFASLGSSFRLTHRLAQSKRELTGMACYSHCSRRKVSSFLRVMCKSNLQMLSDIISECWAISLALDGATHQSVSYLDIRVRFCANEDIQNCHLLALPMMERHTGQAMFDMVEKLLDVIFPGWKESLVGVATDGARNMKGLHVGLLTLLDSTTGPNFIRVWCGAHQLDLVLAEVYGELLKDDLFSILTALIGYLRRQQILVSRMKTTCPKVTLSRWLSMIKVMKCFKKHRIDIQAYLNEKLPPCRPSAAWWVLMMTLNSFADEASSVFTRIQGKTMLVSQQVAELSNLSQTYCRMVQGKGPMIPSELQAIAEASAESGGLIVVDSFAVPITNVEHFVRGLGSFVSSMLDGIPAETGARLPVLKLIGTAFISAASQLTSITVERSAANENAAADDQLPPVMPHELLKCSRAQFCANVCKRVLRLAAAKFTPQQIEEIEEEHGDLIRCYHAEPTLRAAIDASDHKTSFNAGWGLLRSRFPALYEFSGGLASVFRGTSTIEADVSRLRREKDIFRQNLSVFGLECVLHAQQHKALQNIVARK